MRRKARVATCVAVPRQSLCPPALLQTYGDQIWLDRAHELAEHAAKAIRKRQLRRNSLYRGEVGVCLLAADLNDPYQARMPLFELC